MIFLFEAPIIGIALIILGFLGINLIPILTVVLSLSLIISIIWLFFAENRILNLINIGVHIIFLILLDGKKFYLWDIIEWLF